LTDKEITRDEPMVGNSWTIAIADINILPCASCCYIYTIYKLSIKSIQKGRHYFGKNNWFILVGFLVVLKGISELVPVYF